MRKPLPARPARVALMLDAPTAPVRLVRVIDRRDQSVHDVDVSHAPQSVIDATQLAAMHRWPPPDFDVIQIDSYGRPGAA